MQPDETPMQHQIEMLQRQIERLDDVIEKRAEQVKQDLARHELDEAGVFTELHGKLDRIERQLQKQKGFIGGIVFIVSALAWCVYLVKDWVFAHWR